MNAKLAKYIRRVIRETGPHDPLTYSAPTKVKGGYTVRVPVHMTSGERSIVKKVKQTVKANPDLRDAYQHSCRTFSHKQQIEKVLDTWARELRA